jgi:hypothetical protein
MGVIRMMAALLKAAGYEVHDVSRPDVERGRGATLDEWGRLDVYPTKEDPEWAVTTNRQPAKPKAPAIHPVVSKRVKHGRPKRKLTAGQQSKRRQSLFELLKRLKGGEK